MRFGRYIRYLKVDVVFHLRSLWNISPLAGLHVPASACAASLIQSGYTYSCLEIRLHKLANLATLKVDEDDHNISVLKVLGVLLVVSADRHLMKPLLAFASFLFIMVS